MERTISDKLRGFSITLITIFLAAVSQPFAETLVLQPGSEGIDTYTCNCAPNTNNPFGPITKLYQGQIGVCYNIALSQWDISAIPPEVIITEAIVEFMCYQMEGAPTGEMLYSRIVQDWGETSVTHNTLPRISSDNQVVTAWPVNGQWHQVDITEFVQGWYDGVFSNYGILLHSTNTSGTSDANWYSSDYSAAAYRPKLTITYTPGSGVTPNSDPHSSISLSHQSHPNPFNPTTTISFDLPVTSEVKLNIFDIHGRDVGAGFKSAQYNPGTHQITFDGSDLASGIYIYRLTANDFTASGKMVLMK